MTQTISKRARQRISKAARRAWWAGYEDAYTGQRPAVREPYYLAGHLEGAAALGRLKNITTAKRREDSLRSAAPDYMRLVDLLGRFPGVVRG